MTKLLRAYFQTEKTFRDFKVRNQYDDEREWSKAFNLEQEKILKQMSASELLYLLEHTQGIMRMIIKEYLDKANKQKIKVRKKKNPLCDEEAIAFG